MKNRLACAVIIFAGNGLVVNNIVEPESQNEFGIVTKFYFQ